MMHTVRLDIEDSVFDKVMFLLNSLPKSKVKLSVENETTRQDSDDIVSFFQNSPLKGEVKLERNEAYYTGRVEF